MCYWISWLIAYRPHLVRNISKMKISREATHNPPRHTGWPDQCFEVYLDAPRPHCSRAMCSQMLQKHSQVLLKAPAVMEVDSGCYEIRRMELSDVGATATSVQICTKPQNSWDCCTALRNTSRAAGTAVLHCNRLGAVFSQQWVINNHKVFGLILFVFGILTRFATL